MIRLLLFFDIIFITAMRTNVRVFGLLIIYLSIVFIFIYYIWSCRANRTISFFVVFLFVIFIRAVVFFMYCCTMTAILRNLSVMVLRKVLIYFNLDHKFFIIHIYFIELLWFFFEKIECEIIYLVTLSCFRWKITWLSLRFIHLFVRLSRSVCCCWL